MKRILPAVAATLAAVLALAGCSTAPGGATSTGKADLSVAAAFYPLQFVAERVGGTHVAITALAPPGVEPHDLELSPSAVRAVRDSNVVLYLSGFQASVDEAVKTTGVHAIDAGPLVSLMPAPNGTTGTFDPHFWLDPTRLATFARAVGEDFARLDPAHADEYRANAATLVADLAKLDASYTAGLTTCTRHTILASHDAFGYLAARYGLTQVGLSGLDPEAEPSPAKIREARAIAISSGATTVFIEALVDPSVVEAFAFDAHLTVATLDPVESLVKSNLVPNPSYITAMEQNLFVLRTALACD
jgi:zinc transport system substrate-binding protein